MAALWPERFPGGWVSVREFGECGVLLGSRIDEESLKAAIRRGLRVLARDESIPAVESRRTTDCQGCPRGHTPRCLDRRLSQPPRRPMSSWLLAQGGGLIEGALWRQFSPCGSAEAADEILHWSLRQVDCCLVIAELALPVGTPQQCAVRRLRRQVSGRLPTQRRRTEDPSA